MFQEIADEYDLEKTEDIARLHNIDRMYLIRTTNDGGVEVKLHYDFSPEHDEDFKKFYGLEKDLINFAKRLSNIGYEVYVGPHDIKKNKFDPKISELLNRNGKISIYVDNI